MGCPRYLSVHPGGIVITPKPINTYVPVETAPKGVPVIQWEKEGTEKAGLVKIDLLGNRSLGVIRDCISSIEQTRKKFDDFQTMDPEDDPATQNLVAQGLTMGCFYIESPAMRLLQKKAKTGDFASLVIHSSIIRPAANAFIQAYLERLHTGKWTPIHPLAKGLLDDTFGIMVFQEDVARAAVCLAGFTHAQADGLRKIMSKKEKHRALSAYYTAFSKGAAAKEVSPEEIKRIWKMILSFSGYSFCKAHSASYARVSFQAAYLKTHYPAQFMAAVISNQGGFYSCFAYVSEARRMGVKILGPDIHKSRIRWQGKKNTLRAGFMAIKGLAQNCMEKIIKERKKRPFSHGLDFFSRVRPQKGHAQALINSGCLDRLTDQNSRAALLWAFYAWQAATAPRSLFSPPRPDIPDLPPDLPMDRLRKEFSTLGFLCSGHPLTLFAKRLQGQDLVKAVDIPAHQGQQVRIAGWLITGKTVRTKQEDPMKFLTFEDDTGIVETVFFPRPYARFCHILDYGKPYILSGTVESEWGAATLTVTATQRISYPEYFMKF
ncbi:MAG: DNA polymerase III subunit alpha [Desulfobacter sp.]|nr:MAG: DNA polymerase III subunit alpha [Desulfobacter sp.]